ncbi:hypothetical protein F511_02470 [Dorcoceras hygrometricum]|nr:hypothetical protein F511_02470 [Dorcoceras hygrometricum]
MLQLQLRPESTYQKINPTVISPLYHLLHLHSESDSTIRKLELQYMVADTTVELNRIVAAANALLQTISTN